MLSTSFFFSIFTPILTVIIPVQGIYTDLHRKDARSLSNSSIPAQALKSLLSPSNLTITNSTTHLNTTEDSVYNDDCNDEALFIVGQAINDAVTMAKTVQQVWSQPKYLPILEKYMGANCDNDASREWIQTELDNIASVAIQPNHWWQLSKLRGIKAYQIGFCNNQMTALFTSLATKLSLAESIPGIRTDEELLAANYGRAAFHALVECSPGINPSKNGVSAYRSGSEEVASLAASDGCGPGYEFAGVTINSLTNADSLAQFVNALYFTIQLNLLPEFPEPAPAVPIAPVPTVTNYACKVPHNNWRCGQMSSGNCLNAIRNLNPTQYYDSFTIPSNGQYNGYGCQAAYACDDYPEPGLTGLQIQNLFKTIHTDDTAADGSKACGTGGRCGMTSLSNNCSVTFSTCFNCP